MRIRSRAAFKAAAIFISASIFMTGCATVKIHPEFNERHPKMKTLVLLPPDIQAYEITFNAGARPLADLMESMKTNSGDTLKTALEEKGYEVTALQLSQQDLDSDAALKEAFFELKKLYDQSIKDMRAGKKKSFTYDIGASGNYFAEKHGANAIVYMRESGSRLSSGMTAAQVASATLSIATALFTGVAVGGGVQPQYSLLVETAVIDADLGDILWYNIKEAHDNFTNPADKKDLTRFILDTIQPFPNSKFKKEEPKKLAEPKPKANQANFSPKATPPAVNV